MYLTVHSHADTSPLCPINDRRAKTEFLVKLSIVRFTTLSAFFHLLHVRESSFPTAKTFYLLILPPNKSVVT
jgi:hypothetical protein